MTLITQILTVITAITILGSFTIAPSYAHTTETSGVFSSNVKKVCFDMTALGSVEVDGDTNKASTVKTSTKNAMLDVTQLTLFSLTEETGSCSTTSPGWISAAYYSDADFKAGVTPIEYDNGIQIKYVFYNTNSGANMITSGTCQWYQDTNLEYVANHEMGHYAGLAHQTGTTSHTMMHASCDVGYAIIREGDITQVDGWYD